MGVGMTLRSMKIFAAKHMVENIGMMGLSVQFYIYPIFNAVKYKDE